MPPLSDIGWVLDTDELRYHRMMRGWKQKDLADEAGIHPSHLSRMLRGADGSSPPSDTTVERLARALDVEPAAIAVWGSRRLLHGRAHVAGGVGERRVRPVKLHPEVYDDATREWPVVPGPMPKGTTPAERRRAVRSVDLAHTA